jgi:hypothetical protein
MKFTNIKRKHYWKYLTPIFIKAIDVVHKAFMKLNVDITYRWLGLIVKLLHTWFLETDFTNTEQFIYQNTFNLIRSKHLKQKQLNL